VNDHAPRAPAPTISARLCLVYPFVIPATLSEGCKAETGAICVCGAPNQGRRRYSQAGNQVEKHGTTAQAIYYYRTHVLRCIVTARGVCND
jgi:hypothetical protein